MRNPAVIDEDGVLKFTESVKNLCPLFKYSNTINVGVSLQGMEPKECLSSWLVGEEPGRVCPSKREWQMLLLM